MTTKKLLRAFKKGKLTEHDLLTHIKSAPFEDLGFAKVDHHRAIRKGFPEVIFGSGKKIEHILAIAKNLLKRNKTVLITRTNAETHRFLQREIPTTIFHEKARMITIGPPNRPTKKKKILIITAGTSDLPVAQEAAVTAQYMGNRVDRLTDVGAAGLHRLLAFKKKLHAANVCIVVAGMDGVLPTIVASMIDRPVIAVPTSIGYGASFKGLAALLTMMNSCSPGIATVNIDNGFGAGYFASLL